MTSETRERAEMAPKYNPTDSESRWYAVWEERGYFRPDPGSSAPTFVITIPPPNITGELHLGHALTYGIEDIIGRFKRMQGFNTLILPGTDHAGIATQNVVERQLAREGLTRFDLGREKFVERVWQWKEQAQAAIKQQFEAMGCSFDWSRERFTMDSLYSEAVLEFFIRMYESGRIYKGSRVINWCVRCRSAISDIEVEPEDRESQLYYVRYPLEDGTGAVTVATTRPETMLGDVAVAVNPNDDRFRDLVGKTARLPLLNRALPIVADDMVRPEFGTGAVKITPAHDFADFEVAERHGLPMPIAIGPDGRVTELGGPYQGQSSEEARDSVLRDLEAGGFLVRMEPYRHPVPTCERCGTVLEPLLSEQWFMRMQELAQPGIEVVGDGRVRIVPERWAKVYLNWMENIRPWTLSRQLWWGHRIPVYYCADGHETVARSWPSACRACGAEIVRQDDDVLDTWFSSALWPFATLGWPRQTPNLQQFYPTSFMNTSSQILYLWIARMIMTGLEFMGDVPFPVVLINPTILNAQGQRMSKSLGTGVDPRDLIAQYGADALRFGLMTSGSTQQQEIRFSPDRVEQARNFGNKVWNVARFILAATQAGEDGDLELTTADRWILSRLQRVTAAVTSDLERFELSAAGLQLHDFVWGELADWYLEMAKLRLRDAAPPNARYTAGAVLWSLLDRVIRLLHPFMPFLTEEVWQQLRSTGSSASRQLSGWNGDLPESVIVAPWPSAGDTDEAAEREMGLVMDLVRAVRTARSEHHIEAGQFVEAAVAAGPRTAELRGHFDTISRLARLEPLAVYEVIPPEQKPAHTVNLTVDDVSVYLSPPTLADLTTERQRLTKELAGAESAFNGAQAKLANPAFLERAPQGVVERERERAKALGQKVDRLRQQLEQLGA